MNPKATQPPATEAQRQVAIARREIHQVYQGNDAGITLMFVALAAQGHILMEGIPGVGKTTLAKTFAAVTGLEFNRIQLTPDLMPTDITGHTYYDQKTGQFKTRQGPVFTNVLLADEINRTPPRTQAALLEVMQERQVTIEGQTLPVPDPFLIVATKNPIEVEGVYPLPEAELDRFMVSLHIGYPERDVENAMLAGKLQGVPQARATPNLHKTLQEATRRVRVHPDITNYLLDLVAATRNHESIDLGASPRASEQLMAAARAHAAILGRDFAVPDDVKWVAPHVLSHRLLLSAEAEVQGVDARQVVRDLLEKTPVPVKEGATRA